MAFVPKNQKQQEAFDFATQLSDLLNQGIQKGFIDRTYSINYAVSETLINYNYGNAGNIFPAIPKIEKL